jgi:superoxide oxidase
VELRVGADALGQSGADTMNAENSAPRAGHPSRERHQTLTIVLHWVTALLVFTQIALAILHDQASDAGIRRGVLAAHRSLGIAIWLLVMGRLAWRLLGMRLPPFPASMPRWHQWGARLSEWGLYGLLLVQPVTGMAATVLRGQPFNLFGLQVPSLMAPHKAWVATAQGLHTLGAYALASLVLVHAGAAILHRVIANDGVLESMLPAPRARRGTPLQAIPE